MQDLAFECRHEIWLNLCLTECVQHSHIALRCRHRGGGKTKGSSHTQRNGGGGMWAVPMGL